MVRRWQSLPYRELLYYMPVNARYIWYRDPLFLGSVALYGAHELLRNYFVFPELISSHFNDALLIPAALPPVLALQHACRCRSFKAGAPRLSEVLFHLCFWSLFFEWAAWRRLPVGIRRRLSFQVFLRPFGLCRDLGLKAEPF